MGTSEEIRRRTTISFIHQIMENLKNTTMNGQDKSRWRAIIVEGEIDNVLDCRKFSVARKTLYVSFIFIKPGAIAH